MQLVAVCFISLYGGSGRQLGHIVCGWPAFGAYLKIEIKAHKLPTALAFCACYLNFWIRHIPALEADLLGYLEKSDAIS
jgi:hypothetical protein